MAFFISAPGKHRPKPGFGQDESDFVAFVALNLDASLLHCAARAEGLRYVYFGNVPGLAGAGTTWCPNCKRAVIERDLFAVTALNLDAGRCRFCGTKIAGVWV